MNERLEHFLERTLKADNRGTLLIEEDEKFEFKISFDWANKRSRMQYLKSIAAFANNSGGFILFGIDNNSKEVVGCDQLLTIDSADISDSITRYFSSQIPFERYLYELKGTTIGIIAVRRSRHKPVVCIKDYDDILREASIYFRYYGKSDKIKAGDLLTLLEEVRQNESNKFLRLLSRIGRIGVDKVALLDTEKGEISNNYGNRFILSEELLKDIKVIDEYQSKERDGAPAVKIIGTVEVEKEPEKEVIRFLREDDLILAFLKQEDVIQPQKYLEQFCYRASSKLPIYFYIHKAGFTLDEATEFLLAVNKSSQTKNKLIERLKNDDRLKNQSDNAKVDSGTEIGEARKSFFEQIGSGAEVNIQNATDAKRFLEAVLNLSKGDYELPKLLSQLKSVFEQYYSCEDKAIPSLIRSAIAYIDLLEFRENTN